MSTRKKPTNFVQRLLKRVWRSFNVLFKALLNWVLRGLRVNKRRSRQSQAGFVLPTVVMVLLVVTLLTTAIVIRSFDRAKNASNFRVDQAVLNAATPAIDRAKAKLERLLSPDENDLSGSPPGEGKSKANTGTISEVLSKPKYTFGDETQLKLVATNPNPIQNADPLLNEPATQTLETAWKFPVDTDNNGKYDTFTLYGIYFRNPPVNTDGTPKRARTPLEARALPQATGQDGGCASGSGAGSGINGWYPTDGQLKKAFFVYVANVPISQTDIDQLPPPPPGQSGNNKYEPYKGNKGFSALEMQEDQARISLDNNAVWYDDDLVISNVPTFRVNGRIHTNSNLMTVNPQVDPDKKENNPFIIFYQVSALDSCYYNRDNGQISVGGNVLAGDIASSKNSTNQQVQVHLYQGTAIDPSANNLQYIDDSPANATTASSVAPSDAASNSGAYDKRLNLLVQEALALYDKSSFTGFPTEVINDFNSKYDKTDPASARSIVTQVLTSYFAKRIRRVSYKEVPFGNDPLVGYTSPPFPPPAAWMSQVGSSQPDPNIALDNSKLATSAEKDLGSGTNLKERFIGDRILVGNGLPTEWLKTAPSTYAKKGDKQDIAGATYQAPTGGQKQRISQVEQLDDLGDTSRGGFWEQAAAYSGNAAKNYQELAGGLRIVTGAGIYIDDNEPDLGVGTGKRNSDTTAVKETSRRSFLPPPPTAAELQNIAKNDANGVKLPPEILNATGADLLKYKVVWPDTMPMFRWDKKSPITTSLYDWAAGEVKRGDLQMRATVVYHYAQSKGAAQEPIACVATYYDPTNPDTAQNVKGLTQIGDQKTPTDYGTSINGVNYPYSKLAGLRAASNNAVLQRQANMIFPDGRWVNKPLRDALEHLKGGVEKLTINDIAAIDATNCALTILYGVSPEGNTLVPDGAIQERTFLDARQIKAIHKRDTDKAGNTLKRLDPTTNALVDVDRQTLLQDITDPAKLKIAELGSLAPIDPTTKKESSLLPEYSLPIEQRQPLEIRVTQIDLEQLRKKQIKSDYMLPDTGIIYATRDDALADTSDSTGGSATDFKLDPTRRPNGIRLINGQTLARQDSNANRLTEKGLILASDLPVYIKGPFNLHAEPETVTSADPTFREEFTDPLITPSYSNFYSRTVEDKAFACRKDASGCKDKGDQWRPARILADAVTLLSSNFRDGYRNEGDFDLNNNTGNLAVEARLKNGFWWNSFATSAEWYDTTNGYPKQGSSYVTNGVTPIQRRVSFPEYKMEICEKFPVSACGPTDWKKEVGGTKVGGTTAAYEGTAPTNPRYVDLGKRVFPRRVAFKRNQFGALLPDDEAGCKAPTVPTDPNPCKAVPIGMNGSSEIEVPYNSSAPALPNVSNALWYVTTTSKTNPSEPIKTLPPLDNYQYDSTTSPNLYYPPFDDETVSERQFLLPGMPESLTEILKLLQIWTAATPSLNGTANDDTPDYAVYSVIDGTANCQMSKAYRATENMTSGACPINAATGIKNLWEGLRNNSVPIDSDLYLPVVKVKAFPPATSGVTPALDTVLLQAEAKLNIYNLPTSEDTPNAAFLSNLEITLDGNGQDDPIFVFRTEQNIDFRRTVEVKLKGVDPNNIFWVSGLGTRIALKDEVSFNSAHPRHKLVGNFIGGSTGAFLVTENIGTYVRRTAQIPVGEEPIQGGRILGFNKTYPDFPITAGVMTALTTTDQPLVMPVLQLHSAQGTPSSKAETAFGTTTINANYWVQRVPSNTAKKETIYNAVFIMGDSPSRPLKNTANPGESGGGLGNFPRFLEAWEDAASAGATNDVTAKAINDIKGSFIQFKKSAFATAPFEVVDDPTQDNSLFFDGASPAYMTGFLEASGKPYIYKGGAAGRKAPYYRPPQRQWGYDVGLLSQTPDLFSRRFANPTVGTPNQYFRQVNRDDQWVQTLLCAAQPNTGGTGYDWAIADPQQRPSNCLAIN